VPEEIRDQLFPAPDEAPLTDCPWCGKEYNTSEDEPDDYQVEQCLHAGVYPQPCDGCPHWNDFCNLPMRHKPCGHLVRFIPTGADSEFDNPWE